MTSGVVVLAIFDKNVMRVPAHALPQHRRRVDGELVVDDDDVLGRCKKGHSNHAMQPGLVGFFFQSQSHRHCRRRVVVKRIPKLVVVAAVGEQQQQC